MSGKRRKVVLSGELSVVVRSGWRCMMLRLLVISLLVLLVALGGCGGGGEVANRMGSYASSTIGTNFLEPGRLGAHGQWLSEKNGIVYTCSAGHIDIAHLRNTADWTAFLIDKSFKHLMKGDTEFRFRLEKPSQCYVQITYPRIWYDLSVRDKEYVARYISIRLGEYLAYNASVWHEIITWFGYKCTGVYPEFASAFSWEDTFSNVLGSHIGALACQDSENDFDKAVTLILDQELRKLNVQSRTVARGAADQMKGQWFSGDGPFVDMKKRNFDIGLDDGYVEPWTVSSVRQCSGLAAKPYRVPDIGFLSDYGFTVKFEIEPKCMEKDRILGVVYPNARGRKRRIEPAVHFAGLMSYIKEEAIGKYGPDVQVP